MSKTHDKLDRKAKRRASAMLYAGGQTDLFGGETPVKARRGTGKCVGFIDPDPFLIFVGKMSLFEYLKNVGEEWVTLVRDVIREVNYRPFAARYDLGGRAPYAPAAMVALILYGMMKGQESLRALERLAKIDLGAMWVCGGINPDHASIGRFVNLHVDLLTQAFFEELTQRIIARLGSKSRVLAGDGTVFHAAASRLSTIKREAALQEEAQARAAAAAAPDDLSAAREAERATAVATAVEQRAAVRARSGADPDKTQACTTDPDAGVIKDKRGQFQPGYTSSVLVNEDGIILSHHTDPTSELASVAPMVEQTQRVIGPIGDRPVLLDGNYPRGEVLTLAEERELNLLAPVTDASDDASKNFPKSRFQFDHERGTYICPAGKQLKRSGTRTDKRRGESYELYRASTSDCRGCPLRERCLSKKAQRRTIARHRTDPVREGLREVMKQPGARRLWNKRKVMPEPVFAELRGAQGFQRFRRYGLRGVQVEFALHACAHNLRRLVRRAAAWAGAQLLLWLYAALWLLTSARSRAPRSGCALSADGGRAHAPLWCHWDADRFSPARGSAA